MTNRASLGFDDDDDLPTPPKKDQVLDLSEFKPKPVQRVDTTKIAEAAAKTNFKSREAKPAAAPPPAPVAVLPPTKAVRRHRTGRTAQLNLKLRPDTIEKFYAVADANGWVLGEAFERAVAMLEQAQKSKRE
ncbi:stability/partitioning determinant [Rhizobium rhizoryzae]|uniref:stability/partitioning determinant n=1 Tax=Rhizobium rhizoryzae TaxID=451876 RepID=UPI0028A86CB7|nr:stability/partitioning determinant [Rhizobium rhizoryzae]